MRGTVRRVQGRAGVREVFLDVGVHFLEQIGLGAVERRPSPEELNLGSQMLTAIRLEEDLVENTSAGRSLTSSNPTWSPRSDDLARSELASGAATA